MTTEPAEQPHDKLFAWTFSQREHLIGLLKAALPSAMSAAIDWSTLRIEKGSFVDRALRGRRSDLLCSVKMAGQPLLLYTLFEHQRAVEARMAFRVDLYMTRIWERYVDAHPTGTTLPPILPIVVHHSETGWTAARSFQELIACEGEVRAALLPHIPHFSFLLVDLSPGQAGVLVEQALTALGRVVLWALSVAGDDRRLEREIGRLSAALDEVLGAPNGLAALEVLLRYLLETHRRMAVPKLSKLLAQVVGPRAQESIVTVLDEIEQRGERRGRRQGRAKMLVELLHARFGAVPAAVKARIKTADEAELSRWAVRVLSAKTAAEVIDEAREGATSKPAERRSPRRTGAAREGAPRGRGAKRA